MIMLISEPTLLLAFVVAAGVPLFLFPGVPGLLMSLGVAALGAWIDHRVGESVRHLPLRVGPESMQGQTAVVLEPLDPTGTVQCGGEVWRAVEPQGRQLSRGETVRVVRVRGLLLEVVRQGEGA